MRTLLLLAALLLAALPSPASADPPAGGAPLEVARTVARTGIWKDINSGKACSASVAIMDQGRLVYFEGFGAADRERSTPVDRDTLFNIGSVSKVFTAVAVMLLVDEGKVRLDEPVTTYLPDFVMADPRYRDITVRMLLNHTSGLPGTTGGNNFGFAYNPDIYRHTLATLATAHLKHRPGAAAPYCNDGFTLAEMIVVRVSGRKFLDFLAERVFGPLGLGHSGAGVGERPGQPAAVFYAPDTGRREPLQVVSLLGCGGLGSTAEDLCRFADQFSGSGPQILSPSALQEMKKAQPPLYPRQLRGPEIAVGLGWDLTGLSAYEAQGVQVLGKSGGTERYTSMVYTVPEHRLSVAVVEAGENGSAIAIALKVLEAVLVEKGLVKETTPAVARPPAPQPIPRELAEYEGYYAPLMRVSFDFQKNLATVQTLGPEGDEQPPPVSLVYHDGYFHDPAGSRFYFATAEGHRYYVVRHDLFQVDQPAAQKLEPLASPRTLAVDLNGRQWLLRSARPFEGASMDGFYVARSRTLADLPGYVDFCGIMEVSSPDSATMPVSAVRDLFELALVQKGGSTWVRLSDHLFSPADEARPLQPGSGTLTIGPEGCNEWLRTGTGLVLTFRQPARGRTLVFTPDGAPLYDSATQQGAVYAPEGSFLQFSGYPGDALEVTGQ